MKLPMTNRIPGGSDTQKMLRQAVSLNANSLAGVAQFGDFVHADAEIHADDRCRDDAQREQPLENAVPLPRLAAPRHSARYSGTTTPIKPALTPCNSRPKTSGVVAVSQRDDRDADHKQHAAEGHHLLAAHPVRQHAGEQG